MGDQKPFSKARCHPTCRLTQNQDLTSQRRILPAMTLSLPMKVFAVAACLLMVGCTASNDCDTFRAAVRSVQRRRLPSISYDLMSVADLRVSTEEIAALNKRFPGRDITESDVCYAPLVCQNSECHAKPGCWKKTGVPSYVYFEDNGINQPDVQKRNERWSITKMLFCDLFCECRYKVLEGRKIGLFKSRFDSD